MLRRPDHLRLTCRRRPMAAVRWHRSRTSPPAHRRPLASRGAVRRPWPTRA